jgi:hypothetical protein
MAEKNVLGPPQIQVLPQGLLGFLGIKNGGQFPQTLLPDLAPTLDLLEIYLQTDHEVIFSGPVSILAPGYIFINPFTVPQNEYWAIIDWGVEFPLGAGEAIKVALGYSLGGTLCLLSDRTELSTVGGALMAVNMNKQRPILLPPNTSLGYLVSEITGTLDAVNTLRISRLKI